MKDLKEERFGEVRKNNQGCEMKIVEYKNANKIKVEFNDKYKTIVSTRYEHFVNGDVTNPYHPSVYGVGISGNKYPIYRNNRNTIEYNAWRGIIQRCYDPLYRSKWKTYEDVKCCTEWLLYDNFYEWIITQENYEKWKSIKRRCVDKDILIKGNKIYCPEACSLVPPRINALFTKADISRGNLPIGVMLNKRDNTYIAEVDDNNKHIYLGKYKNQRDAFEVYKEAKEKIIKRIAEEEYSAGRISNNCYEAMMSYKVDYDD